METETFDLQNDSFTKMADFFYTNGFVILENALSPEMLDRLRNDLHSADTHFKNSQCARDAKNYEKNSRHKVHKCFFENSVATVDLIENSKLTDFAQHIISDVPGSRP